MSGRTSATACSAAALVGDVGEHQLPAPAAHLGDRPAEQPEVGQPVVVDLGGDRQLAPAAPEGDGEPRGTGTEEGRRLRREVDGLLQPRLDHPVEDVAAERPVQPLDEAEADRLVQEGERVGELGAGLAASGGLPADHRVVGEPAYRLQVGAELCGVGDQLLDEDTGAAGAVEVVDQAGEGHARPSGSQDGRLEEPRGVTVR